MSRLVPASFLLAAAASIAACSTTDDGQRLSGEPNYGRGYSDGCQTAAERNKSFSTKSFRDAELFDHDEGYRAGFRYGYQSCNTRVSRSPDGGRILGQEGDR